MDVSLNGLFGLVLETLRRPQSAARRVLSVPLPMSARWQGLALVVILSVILTQLGEFVLAARTGQQISAMLGGPVRSGMLQGIILVGMVFAVYLVGRAMGGQAGLGDTLQIMVWLQLVMVVLQALQVMSLVILPMAAGWIGIAGVVLFFWLLTNFVLVAHGFRSILKVFLMIVVSLFAMALFLALVLMLLGLRPVGI